MTLAQHLGLVPRPPPLLTEDQWTEVHLKSRLRQVGDQRGSSRGVGKQGTGRDTQPAVGGKDRAARAWPGSGLLRATMAKDVCERHSQGNGDSGASRVWRAWAVDPGWVAEGVLKHWPPMSTICCGRPGCSAGVRLNGHKSRVTVTGCMFLFLPFACGLRAPWDCAPCSKGSVAGQPSPNTLTPDCSLATATNTHHAHPQDSEAECVICREEFQAGAQVGALGKALHLTPCASF